MLNISYAVLTNKGNRKINEDCLGIYESADRLGFILCDGLGGHGNGDVASHIVVDELKRQFGQSKSMEEGIMEAQSALMDKQTETGKKDSMKTTVACLEIFEENARFGHVGDSRIYYFEKAKLKLRSLDHSVPQMLVDCGRIKEKDIRFHEDRNRLIKVMGTNWNKPKYEISKYFTINTKTSFLLCSDGFWELIEEKVMSKLLKKAKSPNEWLAGMEKVVCLNGEGKNMDNYSAIAVFIR